MPNSGEVSDVHDVLAGRLRPRVGQQVEQRAARRSRSSRSRRTRAARRARPGGTIPRTSSRLRPGRLERAGALGDDHRAGDDAPRRAPRSPGTTKKSSPIADADLVDERAEHERAPRHGAEELAGDGSSCAVQVAGDDLLRCGGEELGDEQLEHEHDDHVDARVDRTSKWSVSMSTPCATPVSSSTASGSQRSAAIAVRYQKWRRQNRTASRSTGARAMGGRCSGSGRRRRHGEREILRGRHGSRS